MLRCESIGMKILGRRNEKKEKCIFEDENIDGSEGDHSCGI
jgi:hypothetical protein